MTTLRDRIIAELHVKPTIDPTEEIRTRIDFLKNYARATGSHGYVLGISGGQDSTLAGRLGQLAAEELRAEGYHAEPMKTMPSAPCISSSPTLLWWSTSRKQPTQLSRQHALH